MIEGNFGNIPTNTSKDEQVLPNGLEQKTIDKVSAYFSKTPSSKAFIAARTLSKKFLKNDIGLTFINSLKHTEPIKSWIEMNKPTKGPVAKATAEDIFKEFEKAGLLSEPVKEKKKKREPDMHVSDAQIGKRADISPEEQEILDQNLLIVELEKNNIFKNKEAVEEVYNETSDLNHPSQKQGLGYYKQFSDVYLIKGGYEQVKKDFEKLKQKKEVIKKDNETKYTPQEQLQREHYRRISVLTERAVVVGFSQAKWLGENVVMNMTSEYGDIVQKVDGILNIKRREEKDEFLGVGIDVTFNGLKGKLFQNKFVGLVDDIAKKNRTRVRYEVDSEGRPLEQFIVPRILIHFDSSHMKNLMDMLRSRNSETLQKDFEEAPEKKIVLKQIIHQCRKLGAFAKEAQNNVFRSYYEFLDALEELSWDNKELADILQSTKTEVNDFTQRIDEIIEGYRNGTIKPPIKKRG